MRPLLATLVGLGLLTAGLSEARQRKNRDEGRARIADEGVAFRLLPGGGGQSTVPGDFCGLFSSYLVGNHFCLNGDATQRSGMTDGGTAMTLSPATASAIESYTAPLCPNGANCAPATWQRTDGGTGSYWHTSATTAVAGTFTACACLSQDELLGAAPIIMHDLGGLPNRSILLRTGTTATLTVFYPDAGTVGVNGPANSLTARARNSMCAVYTAIGAGTSTATVYVNGAPGTTNSTLHPLAEVEQRWAVGAYSGGQVPLKALWANALLTESAWTPAQVLDYDRACNGHLSGSFGEAVTFTRTSAASCYDESGQYITQLPAGRACVSRMSLAGRPAVTNLQIRSEELGTGWTTTSANVGTADQHIAPDGSKTAETVTSTGAGGRLETTTAVAVGAASAAGSLWVKTTTGTQAGALVVRKTTATAADICTAEFTATTEWQQVGCFGATTSGHSHTLRIYPGGVAGTGTIVAWGAQLAAAAYLPDYCGPTAGTSLTCAAETAAIPTPPSLSLTEGCMRACVAPNWTGTPPVAPVFSYGNVAATTRFFYGFTDANTIRAYAGGGIAAVDGTYERGVRKCYATRWSASRNALRIENESTGASHSVAFSGFPSFDATLSIGSGYGTTPSNAAVTDIQFGTSFEACR
jgi:hypothetical protein